MWAELKKDDSWIVTMSCAFLESRIRELTRLLEKASTRSDKEHEEIEITYKNIDKEIGLFINSIDRELDIPTTSSLRGRIWGDEGIEKTWTSVEEDYMSYWRKYWRGNE